MTDAEKIETFDEIVRVIKEQFALMKHQEKVDVGFYAIESAKVDAYRKIAFLATGIDPN